MHMDPDVEPNVCVDRSVWRILWLPDLLPLSTHSQQIIIDRLLTLEIAFDPVRAIEQRGHGLVPCNVHLSYLTVIGMRRA